MELFEQKGDAALANCGKGKKIIIHVVNTLGGWGKGFVLDINKRYGKDIGKQYRVWHKERNNMELQPNNERNKFKLGGVQIIEVSENILIGNMLAQIGVKGNKKRSKNHNNSEQKEDIPLQYEALRQCLENIVVECKEREIQSVHMPRIGCGLAGGNWDIVKPMIEEIICLNGGIAAYIYTIN